MRAIRLVVAWAPLVILSLACGVDVPPPHEPDENPAPSPGTLTEPAPASSEAESAVRSSCPPFESRWGVLEGERVGRAEMGEGWPLTVEEGCLYCDRAQAVIFVHGGRNYGVNGTGSQEYGPIDPIWADGPNEFTPKMNVGPLIQRGLQLCE